MAQTQNSSTPIQNVAIGVDQQQSLVKECSQHEADSYAWLSTLRKDWDGKESILLGYQPEDSYARYHKSKIVDQSLSSMIMERASRVAAGMPVIESFAENKNSVGKSMLMNTALRTFQDKADEEGSHLLKLRFFDVYSHVHGSCFGLVPWRVNRINGFVGPELMPINIRDVRPQPGRRTIDKMDQFGVRSKVTVSWLKQQDPGTWMNIDNVIAEYKERKDAGASSRSTSQQSTSYIERTRYPTLRGDSVFPDIEIFTEYRRDMWITWAPRNVDNKTSKPWILRVVKNPYVQGFLPIVKKDAFPLLDSVIGLGDIERGKTLQFAKNSLINMYMDGVKMAIFPPVHINLDNVDPASIKWGAAEKWYMKNPNVDVQVMNLKPTDWINTFESTFGFLTTQIQNLAGTTSISETPGAAPTLGKTPDAIQQYGANQNARDAWDTFMMEDFVRQVYSRWIPLIANKMTVPQTFRVFGSEISDLQKEFPEEDILDIFSNGQRGSVTFNNDLLHHKNDSGKTEKVSYSFEIAPDSMSKPGNADENEVATTILQDFAGPAGQLILANIQKQGKDIDFAELYKRKLIGGGVKDWDKIIIDPNASTQNPNAAGAQGAMMGMPPGMAGATPGTPGMPPPPPGGAQQPGQAPVGKPPSQLINYKDAPDDIRRQMEQAEGYQPSQEVTSSQIVQNAAQSQGIPSQVSSRPDLPMNSQGVKDPAIAKVMADVMGGTNGIPPANGQQQ